MRYVVLHCVVKLHQLILFHTVTCRIYSISFISIIIASARFRKVPSAVPSIGFVDVDLPGPGGAGTLWGTLGETCGPLFEHALCSRAAGHVHAWALSPVFGRY